jgi:hypothetical protein
MDSIGDMDFYPLLFIPQEKINSATILYLKQTCLATHIPGGTFTTLKFVIRCRQGWRKYFRSLLAAVCAILMLLLCPSLSPMELQKKADREEQMSDFDRARDPILRERAADWRVGALVYQVFVDRFASGADPQSKKHLYPAPRKLRSWDELPKTGTYLMGRPQGGHRRLSEGVQQIRQAVLT